MMSFNKIQSTGSFDTVEDTFSLTIAPNDRHAITFDGLSIEDMRDIKDLIDILIEGYKDSVTI